MKSTSGFQFCKERECRIAYFNSETNEIINKEDLTVSVGQKETCPERLICYCFNHSAKDLEEDIIKNNESTIFNEIKDQCKAGKDKCEENNPQGSCCLGNVSAVIKDTEKTSGKKMKAALDCCASNPKPEIKSKDKKGIIFAIGALVAALLSSACCWLPLVLLMFGASAAGISGFFEEYRFLFLTTTVVALAAGFYLLYFRKKCTSESECEAPNPKMEKLNKLSLWILTVFVGLIAFFPNYLSAFISDANNDSLINSEKYKTSTILVSGMTCEACSVSLETGLKAIPGIKAVSVDYESGLATVGVDKSQGIPLFSIENVIKKLGYEVKPDALKTWTIMIEGMTCEACTGHIKSGLSKVPGVKSISVSYKASKAKVLTEKSVSENALKKAISDVGYKILSLK